MAKKAKAEETTVDEATGVVEGEKEETKEPVFVEGRSLVLWEGGGFKPGALISKDMPVEQRQEAMRAVSKQANEAGDRLNLVLGETLYEINENSYWKEYEFTDPETKETRKFESFDEYAYQELNIASRKAKYLVQIYRTLVLDFELADDFLTDLEWSKAVELLPILDKDNVKDLLTAAKSKTLRKIREEVKIASGKVVPGSSPDDDMIRRNFKLTKEQSENLTTALELAASMSGSSKDGNNLDMICVDFVGSAAGSGASGALAKLDAVKSSVERAFGVKLEVTGFDEDRYKDLAAAESGEETAKEEAVAAS